MTIMLKVHTPLAAASACNSARSRSASNAVFVFSPRKDATGNCLASGPETGLLGLDDEPDGKLLCCGIVILA